MTLTYLFTATFADDSTFTQNPEDVSRTDPKRSAFTDLLAIEKPLIRFELTGNGHTYSVDLTSGEFAADGPYAWLERDELPTIPTAFRLIYYRRHRHHFKAGSRDEIGHEVMYCLGWQTTINGENYQQVMGVS